MLMVERVSPLVGFYAGTGKEEELYVGREQGPSAPLLGKRG